MILLKLFLEFIKIGTFSFGGGFATLPYIYELSKTTNWFSLEEVNKMVTISQMTPGPLACNMATYVGMKLCGIIGSLIATVSFIIPAVVFMTIIYNLISKIQNNKKVENVLKTIRASAYASILASCTIILKMTYLKE